MHSSSFITLEIESLAYCAIRYLTQAALLYRSTTHLGNVCTLENEQTENSMHTTYCRNCMSSMAVRYFVTLRPCLHGPMLMFKTFRNKITAIIRIGVTRAVIRLGLECLACIFQDNISKELC